MQALRWILCRRNFRAMVVACECHSPLPQAGIRELVWVIAVSTGPSRFKTQESTVSMAPSNNGFLLLDGELNLIASNDPALQILCFPSEAQRIKQPRVFLADRVRTNIVVHEQEQKGFVKEFKSGKRRYICKSFQVDCNGHYSPQPAFAVLLERDAAGSTTLTELSERFDLTLRERETVEFLLPGIH